MHDLWTEKYRPTTVSDYVFKDARQKEQVEEWIKAGAIPHLLFSGSAGLGKTTLAKMLLHEIGVDWGDVLEINGSSENGVEEVRNRIVNFASTMGWGEFRYVLIDECLKEDTLVVVLRNGNEEYVPIKDLDDRNDLVKSFNVQENRIEWKPFVLYDKGRQDTLEIEFENGEVITCTPDHKWYVKDDDEIKIVKASELSEYGHILS